MAMSVKKTKLDVNGKVINIGVDVHKRSWRMTALVEGVSGCDAADQEPVDVSRYPDTC